MSNEKAAKKTAAPTKKTLNRVDAQIKSAEEKRSYPGTQQNLYTYSVKGWDNYDAKQPNFQSHSEYYTTVLSTTNRALIVSAEGMLSYEALRSEHVEARDLLVKCNDEIILFAISLKGFIKRAYPKNQQATMLTAAGMDNYDRAFSESWDYTVEMSRMMKLFMTTNSVALLASNNMPADFAAKLTPLETNFKLKRKLFIDKEEAAITGIKAKFDANEAIYAALRDMTGTGQIVFKGDKLEFNKFVIARLLKTARGNSPSGVKGYITTGANGKVPISNVKVSVPDDFERFTYTDADDKYNLTIPSGKKIKIRIEAAEFVTQEFEKNINVGTTSNLSAVMVPAPIIDALDEPIS